VEVGSGFLGMKRSIQLPFNLRRLKKNMVKRESSLPQGHRGAGFNPFIDLQMPMGVNTQRQVQPSVHFLDLLGARS